MELSPPFEMIHRILTFDEVLQDVLKRYIAPDRIEVKRQVVTLGRNLTLIDENKKHNWDGNLEVESRSNHSRHHANPQAILEWQKKNGGPVNKGQKMSDEFREKCRQSALNRKDSRTFHGNQYVNRDGSKKK